MHKYTKAFKVTNTKAYLFYLCLLQGTHVAFTLGKSFFGKSFTISPFFLFLTLENFQQTQI